MNSISKKKELTPHDRYCMKFLYNDHFIQQFLLELLLWQFPGRYFFLFVCTTLCFIVWTFHFLFCLRVRYTWHFANSSVARSSIFMLFPVDPTTGNTGLNSLLLVDFLSAAFWLWSSNKWACSLQMCAVFGIRHPWNKYNPEESFWNQLKGKMLF